MPRFRESLEHYRDHMIMRIYFSLCQPVHQPIILTLNTVLINVAGQLNGPPKPHKTSRLRVLCCSELIPRGHGWSGANLSTLREILAGQSHTWTPVTRECRCASKQLYASFLPHFLLLFARSAFHFKIPLLLRLERFHKNRRKTE